MSEEKTEVIQQPAETEQPVQLQESTPENKKKKWLPYILAAAAVLVALAVGIGIYNTPENRLQRQLDLGNKYLEEGQYEAAALAFEQAITIDERCMEAYAGGLEAYLGAGDVSGAREFYDRTLAMLSSLDETFAAENRESIVGLYLSVDQVYGDDVDRLTEILEEAYALTGEDSRIKDKLVETYIGIGKEKTQGGAYEEALTVYDRLLELDSANTETIDGLCGCLNKYIDVLMKEKRYDEIRALAEKYRDVATGVDFASVLAKITELEKIEAENRAFMKKVYDLMAAEDYEAMHEVDGSEEAAAFVERMEDDRYLYVPDGSDTLNGVGAGVYQFGEGGYYFYYGDYVNGERKGNGTDFMNEGDGGYQVFTGVWDKDAPNGEGTKTRIEGLSTNGNGMRYDSVITGTLVDGLWDGQVNAILTDGNDRGSYDLSFNAVRGIPTVDKTEEFIAKVWWANRPEAGEYIYAYDYHPSVDAAWWSLAKEGKPVGIVGFED